MLKVVRISAPDKKEYQGAHLETQFFILIYIKFYKYKNNNKFFVQLLQRSKIKKGPSRLYYLELFEVDTLTLSHSLSLSRSLVSSLVRICKKGFN